jgi:hypothetical protein
MDGATISAKVYYGHAKAAKYLGLPFDQYRPGGVAGSSPIASANKIGSGIRAAFTNHGPKNFDFGSPSDMKSPLNHILVDDRIIAVFDYFVSSTNGTYFVSDMTPSMPTLAVLCNRTINVLSPSPQSIPVGASGYDGTTAAGETAIMTGWPASVLIDRIVREQVVPESAGFATYRILLPYVAGIKIRGGDIITDDMGRRYDIITAELQTYGWRMAATQVAG